MTCSQAVQDLGGVHGVVAGADLDLLITQHLLQQYLDDVTEEAMWGPTARLQHDGEAAAIVVEVPSWPHICRENIIIKISGHHQGKTQLNRQIIEIKRVDTSKHTRFYQTKSTWSSLHENMLA